MILLSWYWRTDSRLLGKKRIQEEVVLFALARNHVINKCFFFAHFLLSHFLKNFLYLVIYLLYCLCIRDVRNGIYMNLFWNTEFKYIKVSLLLSLINLFEVIHSWSFSELLCYIVIATIMADRQTTNT